MAESANPVQGLGLTLWLPVGGVWPVAVDLVVVPCLALGVAVALVRPVVVPVHALAPDPVRGHAVAAVVPAGVVIAREVVVVRGVTVAQDPVAVVQHLVAPDLDRVADQGLVLGQGPARVHGQCPGLGPVPAVAPVVVVQDPVVSVVPGPGHAVAVAVVPGQDPRYANRLGNIESNPTRRMKELPR